MSHTWGKKVNARCLAEHLQHIAIEQNPSQTEKGVIKAPPSGESHKLRGKNSFRKALQQLNAPRHPAPMASGG